MTVPEQHRKKQAKIGRSPSGASVREKKILSLDKTRQGVDPALFNINYLYSVMN
jgi:hypothetical protein